MITHKDIKVNDYEISLAKLVGEDIIDIRGYLSDNFGDISFKLTRVVLRGGRTIDIEGEHDFPYLTGLEECTNCGAESLVRLHKEANENLP